MVNTYLVCDKCKRTEEYEIAFKSGWLKEQRVGAQNGHLVIRCTDCITGYALRLAGFPSRRTSKKVTDNINTGLLIDYWPGHRAFAFTHDEPEMGYYLTFHRGDNPPFKSLTIKTIEELILAMRYVEPDLRRWYTRVEQR